MLREWIGKGKNSEGPSFEESNELKIKNLAITQSGFIIIIKSFKKIFSKFYPLY